MSYYICKQTSVTFCKIWLLAHLSISSWDHNMNLQKTEDAEHCFPSPHTYKYSGQPVPAVCQWEMVSWVQLTQLWGSQYKLQPLWWHWTTRRRREDEWNTDWEDETNLKKNTAMNKSAKQSNRTSDTKIPINFRTQTNRRQNQCNTVFSVSPDTEHRSIKTR